MLITEPDTQGKPAKNKGMAYKLIRPWAAAALIATISIILFFAFRTPSPKSASLKPPSKNDIKTGDRKPSEKGADKKGIVAKDRSGEPDKKAELYAQILDYESKVKPLFEEAEKLVDDPEKLAGIDPGDESSASAEKKFEVIRPLLAELKGLKPPPGLERCQSSLVNSMSMIQNAIKSEVMYLQSRDRKNIEDAKTHQETSRKRKEYAFEIIEMVKARYAPPPEDEEAGPEEAEEGEDAEEDHGRGGGKDRDREAGSQEPEKDKVEETIVEEEVETDEEIEGEVLEEGEELEEEYSEDEELVEDEFVDESLEEGDEYLEPETGDEYLESEPEEYYEESEDEAFEEEGEEGEIEEGYDDTEGMEY